MTMFAIKTSLYKRPTILDPKILSFHNEHIVKRKVQQTKPQKRGTYPFTATGGRFGSHMARFELEAYRSYIENVSMQYHEPDGSQEEKKIESSYPFNCKSDRFQTYVQYGIPELGSYNYNDKPKYNKRNTCVFATKTVRDLTKIRIPKFAY